MRPIYSLFFLTCIILAQFPANAQSNLLTNAGNVTKTEIKDKQIKLTTQNAFAEITVYTPSVLRIRMDRKPLGNDFSYAVETKPLPGTIASITQNENEIIITTDSLKAIISKKPFYASFYTPSGELINQDDPGLGTSWVGSYVTTYKKLQEGERFIGLGEKTGNLDRKGNGYTNWNSDTYAYTESQDPIYSTIPYYIGIHHKLNYGIFFDNSFQSDFNFGAGTNRFSSFGANGGEMNYYFIYNTTIAGLINSYTGLTGRMTLPPLWSLGYQSSRYSYYPETEVMRVAETLREKHIPADGITLDIHYMDAYKIFTWDKSRFPDPAGMNNKLKSMGFKTTVILDPGIKVEKGYGAYESGVKNDVFLKYPDGEYYTGQVWPGWCHLPDFTNPKSRDWWHNEIQGYVKNGVEGYWNDMNEFAVWGKITPPNVIYDFEGRKATNMEGHNVYGLNMIKATYESARAGLNRRPFVLTRSGYAGLQRYSAIWTGDNCSYDGHMLLGVRLLNSLGVSGVAFTGMDIGGFTGGASVSLFTRWMQIGAFIPYYRNHTGVNTKAAEPWSFGEEALEIVRNYINLRYKLLPYLYSNFYEASQSGMPIMRTLAIDNTFDSRVYDNQYQNQYQFGHAFMVAPFASDAKFGNVYFPPGLWYNFYNGETIQGNTEKTIPLPISKLPLFVKESSIIPMQSLIQSTSEKPTDTLVVHIYKGNTANKFVYYEDDGETYNYEKGDYYKRNITYAPDKNQISLEKKAGSFTSKFKYIKLVLHGFGDLTSIVINDKQASLTDDFVSFLSPITKFEPQAIENPVEGEKVRSVVFNNDNGDIVLKY